MRFLKLLTLILPLFLLVIRSPSYADGLDNAAIVSEFTADSSELLLIDIAKSAGRWHVVSEHGHIGWYSESYINREASFDQNGWPKLPITSRIFGLGLKLLDNDSNYQEGKYVVTYNGTGQPIYRNGAQKDVINSRHGRDVIDVTHHDEGILFVIPRDQEVKDVSIFIPGYDQTSTNIFNQQAINDLGVYKTGGYKFNRLLQSNSIKEHVWSDRTQMKTPLWGSEEKGPPIEVATSLMTASHADGWFSLPYWIDDEYARNMARLIKDSTPADSTIYIEYGDNLLQSSGPNRNVKSALYKLGRERAHTQNERVSASYDEIIANWVGYRSKELCDIFKSQFGHEQSRIQCVINSTASPKLTELAITCPIMGGTKCSSSFDALGVQTYFGQNLLRSRYDIHRWSTAGTKDQLIKEILGGQNLYSDQSSFQTLREDISEYTVLAKKYQLRLTSSEGGQEFSTRNRSSYSSTSQDTLEDLSNDPRMYDIYQEYFKLLNDFDISHTYHSATSHVDNRAIQKATGQYSHTYNAIKDYEKGTIRDYSYKEIQPQILPAQYQAPIQNEEPASTTPLTGSYNGVDLSQCADYSEYPPSYYKTQLNDEQRRHIIYCNKALGKELAKGYGWYDQQFSCLDTLWVNESGWRHWIQAYTGTAFGIPQALLSSRDQATVGWTFKPDPQVQIKWGLEFVEERYGDPCSALRFQNVNHWY